MMFIHQPVIFHTISPNDKSMFFAQQRTIRKHDDFDRVICITPQHIQAIKDQYPAPQIVEPAEASADFVALLTNERSPSLSFSPEDGSEILPLNDGEDAQIPDSAEISETALQLTVLRQNIYNRIQESLDQNHLPSMSYQVDLVDATGCIEIRCVADVMNIIESHLSKIVPGKNYSASASPFHGFQIPRSL